MRMRSRRNTRGRKALVIHTEDGGSESLTKRATIFLFPSERARLTRQDSVPLSPAVRGLIEDSLGLFRLPSPMRAALEADMREHGMDPALDQRDYVVWLLSGRAEQLRQAPKPPQRPEAA